MAKRFITWGPVRGFGPARDSYEAAERDLTEDQEGCLGQRGYSDRDVYSVDDAGYLRDGNGGHVWPSHGRSTGAVRL